MRRDLDANLEFEGFTNIAAASLFLSRCKKEILQVVDWNSARFQPCNYFLFNEIAIDMQCSCVLHIFVLSFGLPAYGCFTRDLLFYRCARLISQLFMTYIILVGMRMIVRNKVVWREKMTVFFKYLLVVVSSYFVVIL